MTKQKGGYQLTFMRLITSSAFPGTHKVADRLMGLFWDPDGGQLSGPEQAGQVYRIQTICLGPDTSADRDTGTERRLGIQVRKSAPTDITHIQSDPLHSKQPQAAQAEKAS